MKLLIIFGRIHSLFVTDANLIKTQIKIYLKNREFFNLFFNAFNVFDTMFHYKTVKL